MPPSDTPATPPSDVPADELSLEQPSRVTVTPSRTIDCWSCETPNTPSRMFCVTCGSFIAVGSGTRPTAESMPFSGPPPVPGDADADVSLPFVAGVAPLGSYSLEAQRRATRRTRTMTAAASVVLAMVVGGAALYLASPLSHRESGRPEAAVVASPDAAPAATERTGAVSGISIRPETVSAPDVAAEPEPVLEPVELVEPDPDVELEPITEAKPVVEPEPVAQPVEAEPLVSEVEPELVEPEPIVEPEPVEPEPIVEPELVEPEPIVEPEPVEPEPEPVVQPDEPDPVARIIEPEPVEPEPELVTEADLVGRSAAVPQPEPDGAAAEPVGYDGSWVCSDQIVIDDSRVRDWSLGRVSFRIRPGYERVVLHLVRGGGGSGDPATITADSMGSWKIQENLPGGDRPGLGRRSIALQLDGGFSGSLAMRGYRPGGLSIIKEFSVYPSGRDGRNVVISADTDGCYRVRVPAWADPSGSVRRAEIVVDIKP